ncbi:hypothetical protein [Roseateles sp. PN1]|uniref:hypothetical protein n=1 Tax=Roseateles sp. PN1 TaxID=3137372 RepID=UPI00313A1267
MASTSLDAYRKHDFSGAKAVIVQSMQPGIKYTRRELEKLTGLRTGTVTGRVFDLIDSGAIESCGKKVCSESGEMVEALKLPAKQGELAL